MGGTEEKPPSKWENSSLHGPPLVCQSEYKVEKLFWIFVIILSVAMFAYEARAILMQYGEDPIAVIIKTKQPTKWPKVHFCPQNWINEAKLAEFGVNTTRYKCAILGSLAWSNTNQEFLVTTCALYMQEWQEIMKNFSQTSLGQMDSASLFKSISYEPEELFHPGDYTYGKVVSYKGVCYRINFTIPFLLFGDAGKPLIYMKENIPPLHLESFAGAKQNIMNDLEANQGEVSKKMEEFQGNLEQSKAAAEFLQTPNAQNVDQAQLAEMQTAAAKQPQLAIIMNQLNSTLVELKGKAQKLQMLDLQQGGSSGYPENKADDIFLYDSGETIEFLDMPKIKTSESPLILIREEEYIRIDSKDVKCGNMSNEERMSATVACIEISCVKMGLKIPMHPGYNSGKPKLLIKYSNFMNTSSHCYTANWNIASKIIKNCFKDAAPSCKSNSYQFSTYPTNDPKFNFAAKRRVPVIGFGYYNSWSSQMVTEFKIYTWDTLMCNLGGMLSLFTGASLFSLVQLVILCIPTGCLKKKKGTDPAEAFET